MRSKVEFDSVVHSDPAERYTFKQYRNVLRKDYNKALNNLDMPLMALLISEFPFSTGKDTGTDKKPLLVLGIDAKKDFKRSAKRLLVGKEEALSTLDPKTVALLEVQVQEKEDKSIVFNAKILRSKGSASKLFRAYNKKLGRLFAPLELQTDEKRSEAEKGGGEGIQDSDGLDESKFLRKLSGYIDEFRQTLDVETRQAVAKKIVEQSAAWLKKKGKKSDSAKVDQIKKAASKFTKVYKKLQLEQQLLEDSGMGEEWLDLYQSIKLDFKRYQTNAGQNPDRFPFDERKEQLLDILEDAQKWHKGFEETYLKKKSEMNSTQRILFEKHKERVEGIEKSIEEEHLPTVDAELKAEGILGPIRERLLGNWLASQESADAVTRLAFLYETQQDLAELKKEALAQKA